MAHSAALSPAPRRGWRPHAVALLAVVVAVGTASAAFTPSTQAQAPGHQLLAQTAPDANAMPAKPVQRPTAAGTRPVKTPSGGPTWTELTPPQRQALQPLAAQWTTISEAQKRKWLALSQNYPKLPAAEQAKLHSRMTEWVALSPQDRSAARLNFAATQQLTPDDKKAKWEAYQALSDEEKRKLAAKVKDKDPKDRPRVVAAPPLVNHNTLLPNQQQTAAPLPPGVQQN